MISTYSTKLKALLFIPFISFSPLLAQQHLNVVKDKDLNHGIEQYKNGHYVQAIHSFEKFLQQQARPYKSLEKITAPNLNEELATYYLTLSNLLYKADGAEYAAEQYIDKTANQNRKERVAYYLGQNYFQKNKYLKALKYYELAGINSLNNDEVTDAKFELAYCYFMNSDFEKAKKYFVAIKEIEGGKYYEESNYYYGLLAYNNKEYDQALKSFKRIEDLPNYKDIVPYYIAEAYYFQGKQDKVIEYAYRYVNQDSELYYQKELRQLIGQVYYERKEYKKALPHFEYYYNKSNKVKKETLFELAYTYYQLKQYDNAIKAFKPLSASKDSMGQHSMYLLGDTYLKKGDKSGAKNAFAIASNMNFKPEIQRNATFLFGTLSYDNNEHQTAANTFQKYLAKYPNANNINKAKAILASILSNSKNYKSAYELVSDMNKTQPEVQKIYQQVTLANGLEALKKKDYETAHDFINKSLEYTPNSNVKAVSQFWKAQLAYEEKDYSTSQNLIEQFIQAARKNENSIKKISPEANLSNAYSHKGYTEMQLQNYESAAKSLNQISAKNTTPENNTLKGDAAFMQKKYADADKYYAAAANDDSKNKAYAYYQRGIIAGINNNTSSKIALLKKVVEQYPKDKITPQATEELANTYLELNQQEEAMTLYKRLANSKSDKIQAKAIYKLGYAYDQNDNDNEAIKYYKKYLEEHPEKKDAEGAQAALKAIYIRNGSPNEYYSYIKNQNIDDLKTANTNPDGYRTNISDEEQAYYDAALSKYENEAYSDAIQLFETYLTKYPNGNAYYKAQFNLGECKFNLKKDDWGLSNYENVIKSTDKENYQAAAYLKVGKILTEQSNYSAANIALEEYITLSNDEDAAIYGHTLILKNHIKAKTLHQAQNSIDYLDARKEQLEKEDQTTVLLSKALHQYSNKKWNEALENMKTLSIMDAGEHSAQARYYIAKILLNQNKLKEAENAGDDAIQKNGNEQYWLEKSYIVIGEVLAAQKDFFNARATLESVQKNARNEALKEEATELLEQLAIEEQEASKLEQH